MQKESAGDSRTTVGSEMGNALLFLAAGIPSAPPVLQAPDEILGDLGSSQSGQ